MKTLEEIKHITARRKGFKSWKNMYMVLSSSRDITFFEYENEVAEEYAMQCCDEQIKACAEKAKIGLRCKLGSSPKTVVSKTSILNTPNVVTTK